MANLRRFAWWLGYAYPPRFRRDLGLSLVDTLDDRMRARRAGGASAARVATAAAFDTLRNAPAEWIREVRLKPDPTYEDAASAFGRTRRRSMLDTLRQDIRYAL